MVTHLQDITKSYFNRIICSLFPQSKLAGEANFIEPKVETSQVATASQSKFRHLKSSFRSDAQ